MNEEGAISYNIVGAPTAAELRQAADVALRVIGDETFTIQRLRGEASRIEQKEKKAEAERRAKRDQWDEDFKLIGEWTHHGAVNHYRLAAALRRMAECEGML